ncbi:amino acid adenylation domain-containing protein [Streptomyces spongiicola]|uniref:Amino acid adenylation domain-containing protein n=1 Tax=Streptomyces spongiicola TaxID=1690221 RepID=A0A388SQ53_9ACTN|nr:non-ribosomal peptide synthetase [Streptomyces spongiicola]GBP98752.1 amino acid adenylation domain-containing protein [Streptomyces spongiicola]
MNTVPELFESTVARRGGETALVDAESTLGYTELNIRVNRLARRLIAHGVGPDALVAIAMPKCNDLIVAIMAVLKAGGAYLPLDPGYPAERLAFMLSDARPVLLLRSSQVASLGAGLPELVLDEPALRAECAALPGHDVARHERRAELRPEHLMYVIHTSGSTGTPKGVAVPHGGVRDMAATQAAVLRAGPGDRVLQWASISFDAAFWDVTLALLSGAALVMVPAEDLLPGRPLWNTLLKYGITHAVLPPAALSETDAEDVLAGGTVMSTGDSCTPTLVRKWSPRRRMFNGYGPTEVTVGATIGGPVRDAGDTGIGTPWIGNEVHVLDERLRPVPPGTEGELYIAGSGLARGYLNRFPATAAKFVADPFGPPGSRMYRTGDRGRREPDGELFFTGRADGQVKLRGFRVELGEIETRLAAHPAVEVAVAVVRGELADAHVVGYVTTTAPVEPGELRAHLRGLLPAHMVPARITVLDRFPTLANGKIDREALPEPAAAAVRADGVGDFGSGEAGGCAAVVCAIVEDVLGVPEARVTDSFFRLGGHSVQATRLAVRIRERFEVQLPIRAVLEAATIGELAASVESRLRGTPPSAEGGRQRKATGRLP